MLKRSLCLSLLLATLVPAGARAALPGCSDADASVCALSSGTYGTGKLTLPSGTPTSLAVFAHGYGHTSNSWVQHMQRTSDAGAVAVSMDYRGTYTDGDGNVRGWRVNEGADDMIAVSTEILIACPSITNVILYGVSMGGNSSGLALTRGAQKPDGSNTPLFNHWIAAEPAANVIETYLEASAVERAVPFAALAKEDIEKEFGGTLAEQPAAYLAGSVVARSQDIDALESAYIIHGFDDGLVPYNQSRELAAGLRAHNIATEFYNVARRNPTGDPDHEGGTTLSENVGKPLFAGAGLGQYPEPLTGHGTESSQTHVVIQAGLNIVLDLVRGTRTFAGDAEFVIDEGTTTRIA